MRVLLIHPEDGLLDGPWAKSSWDRVVDLGFAGATAYERASEALGSEIIPLRAFRHGFAELRRVRELLALGLGRLRDSFGLDWWELTAILIHQQLEQVILLKAFAETLGSQDEVYVSRPGFYADAIGYFLQSKVSVFPAQRDQRRGVGHYRRLWNRFPATQLLEIFWDKTDPGYQLRGNFAGKRRAADVPVVLLPTAYVNVSRTALAYAATLPEAHFLLIATRRSGWVENPPPNVMTAWLSSYASVRRPRRKSEHADLMARWELLKREVETVPEFAAISTLGCFDEFPVRFARGLEIRDAWRNVLETEPVQAVLCADDSNPYTHIPLLLAKAIGLPTVSCHHGALDGRFMFKRTHADVLLAKGKMEQDYLVRQCELPPGQVKVGAPALATKPRQYPAKSNSSIIFFSEPYEVAGGRVRDDYEDILPALADLALSQERELIVKLHPSESVAERSQIIRETLGSAQFRAIQIVSGPLHAELLDQAWFAITILSTVAVECALRAIPCFLCKWLESSPYGYVDQFIRFGVGISLSHRNEVEHIPTMLQGLKPDAMLRENCWKAIETERLRTLYGMTCEPQTAPATQI